MTINSHFKFRSNRKGIGTIFGMVFFILIVVVVFASFLVILNQNTGLEQTTVQAKQLDLDRYTELSTVSVTNPEIIVLNHVVYISCAITNNGTLPAELVRLWIKDVATNTVGNIIMSPSIILQPGTNIQYFNFTYVPNSGLTDQYSFWFITTRGNIISGFPNTNQFSGIDTTGTFPGVTAINSTYNGETYSPLQLSLTTTKPNQLIYVVVSYDDGNTLYTPTSTPALTWTLRGQCQATDHYTNGDSILKTFYAIKPTIGPVTINIQSTADELQDYYCSAMAFAISDVNTTSPFDGSAQNSIGSSAMPQDTISTHYTNELIIGALGIDSLNPAITPGAGFAEIMPVQSSYGASGEPDSMPRSVWTEWSIMQTPRSNLPVNCSFTSSKVWSIIVDAVKLVVIPPASPITLSPTSGPIGQPITVTGQGFANNSRLTAQFDGLPVPFGFTTDASGNIPPNAILTVPSGVTAGPKNVTIFDSKFNIASATFTVTTSTITINPQVGQVGTPISISGANFITNSNITFKFNGNPVASNPSIVTADGVGSFLATFNVASGPAGINQVSASDGANSPYANFTIIPSLTLSPTSGQIGSLVNVTGYGFAASQPVSVNFAGSTVVTIPANVNTDALGSFTASITVPGGQTAGGKIVNASDANANSAIATFAITPSMSLSPTSGDVGSPVMASGSGFAANSVLTVKFAGSTVSISGTTSTDSTGSFTGATFTVPNWASTWAQGNVQTINVTDAATHTIGTTFTVNTVSQLITVTLSNSAPNATVTVNGGNPTPNTFAADGISHSVVIFAGSSFNLSFTNTGNTRNGFIVSNAFSATSPQYIASTNSLSLTAYAQVQNTFRATFNSGNPLSGDSIVLTGTYLGTSSSAIATLNSGNSWQLLTWSDYNTAVAFPISTANSGSNERWALSSPYSTALLTTGGNTYAQTYYHQYLQTLSYIANGSPAAPTATGLAFGVAYAPSLTTNAAPYWFDATGSVAFSTSTGVAGERWAPSPASIVATSAHTQVVSMYHQYQVAASYSTSDATSPSAAIVLTGTALGSASAPTLTTSVQQIWLDATSGWSVNNPVTSGTQRWNAATGTSGTVSLGTTVAPLYYHQYQQTLSYSVLNGGSPAAPTATGLAFGVAYAPSLTTNAAPYWFDATGSVAFSTSTGGVGEQWVPVPSSVLATSAHTQVVSMHHQYQVTFTQSGIDSSAGSNTILTIGSTNYAYNALPSNTYFDATTTFTWASTVSGGSGKQFAITGNSGTSPISAAGTYSSTYKTQYQHTITSSPATGSGYITVDGVAQSTPYTTAWWDSGSTHTIAASSTVTIVAGQRQYQFLSWSDSGAQSHTVSPIAPTTFTANFQTQYYFTVSSTYDSPTGAGWYTAGTTISSTVTTPASGGTGIQYVTTGWTGTGSLSSGGSVGSSSTGSFTINAYTTCTWNWKTQYRVTFAASGLGSVAANTRVLNVGGSDVLYSQLPYTNWFDSGTTYSYYATVASSVSGTQYALTGTSPASPISGTTGTTVTGTYKTQYQLTVTSTHDTPTPATGSWFDASSSVTESVTTPADTAGNTQYRCTGWSSGTGGVPATGSAATVTFIISGPATITWNWQTQYLFTVTSAAGTSGGQSTGYYDTGTSITSSVFATVNVNGPPIVNYTSTGYTGTGNAPTSGSTQTVTFTLNTASNVTWNWHGIMTLYPSADSSNGIPSLTGASTHSQAVSDYNGADATSYVWAGSGNTGTWTDYYTTQDHGSTTGTINTVTENIRVLVSTTSGPYARTYLRLGSNTVTGNQWTPAAANTWTTHSDTLLRPGGGSWAWTDIDSLQSGVVLNRASSTTIECTLVWVVIDFNA